MNELYKRLSFSVVLDSADSSDEYDDKDHNLSRDAKLLDMANKVREVF